MEEKIYVIWRKDGIIDKIQNYSERSSEITIADVKEKISKYSDESKKENGTPELIEDEKIIEVLEFAAFGWDLHPIREEVKNEFREEIRDIGNDLRSALNQLEDI